MKTIFEHLNRPAVSIFTTAGFPERNSLNEQLLLFEQQGIDFVEIGMPFSDPLADGPTIQESSTIALRNGMNLHVLFEQLKARTSKTPIVLMGYINPILRFGLENFLREAKVCGVAGLVLPDISIEIYEKKYKKTIDRFGIPICFLVTPNTTDERIVRSAELARKGFIYLVSSNSTTGSENTAQHDLSKRYAEVKLLAQNTPVVIGFGIKNKSDFDQATQYVDGGIIGSAFIKAVAKGEEKRFLEQFSTPNQRLL